MLNFWSTVLLIDVIDECNKTFRAS